MAVGAGVGAALGGGINYASQVYNNRKNGLDWGSALTCIDMQQLGMAVLEGAVMGAITGATGGIGNPFMREGIDFLAGVAWDKMVKGASWEEAVGNGVANIFFGKAVDVGISAVGKLWKATGADAITRSGMKMLGSAMQSAGDANVGRAMGAPNMRTGNAPMIHINKSLDTPGGSSRRQCPANSFSADTEVSTPDGDVPIAEIEVGDIVLAYNEITGEVGEYTVTDTISHTDEVIIHLYIDGELIETTPEHPFYTDEGEWVDAADLSVGELILSLDGDYGIVESVVVIDDANQPMYNLTVDEAHTFAVGDGRWVVHNINITQYCNINVKVNDSHDFEVEAVSNSTNLALLTFTIDKPAKFMEFVIHTKSGG